MASSSRNVSIPVQIDDWIEFIWMAHTVLEWQANGGEQRMLVAKLDQEILAGTDQIAEQSKQIHSIIRTSNKHVWRDGEPHLDRAVHSA